MSLSTKSLEELLSQEPTQAWTGVFTALWERLSKPVDGDVASEMVRRDKDIEALDLVMSSSAWDLWPHFESCAPKTSKMLAQFWADAPGSKAVLVLDAVGADRDLTHW